MSNDTVISNRTPVAKARCPECDTEQPRTLFVGAICLFCKQGIASKLARDAQLGTLTPGSELQDAQTIARKRLSEMRKRLHEEREHAEQVIARAKVAEASDEAARQAGVDAELARRTLAQRHLLPFVVRHNPDYLPGWVHQDICEHLEWFSLQVAAKLSPRLMICMPPRHGKQLADSTKVLTTRGWSTHGELQVGDEVFHPSGQPVRVEAVSDKTPSDYVVTLTDGSCIRCHANHEWVVYDRPRRKWITVETRWFTDTTRHGVQRKLSTGPIGKRGGRYKYQLPAIAAVQYPEATLPMPPYVLGAWLGDGSRGKPCITHDINDAAVAQAIAQYGYEITSVCTHPQTGVKTTYFSSPKIGALSCFREQLRSLGLDDGAKFIPEMYLRSSMAQRLALLAGLMDTDGHNDGVTGRCRIVTADEALASSLADLCTGLGFRPYVTTTTPTLSTSGIQGKKACYTVGFQPTMDIPCVLPRKRPTRVISQRRVAIQSVEYRPNGEQGHCIEVSSADGLYLAGDRLTPTHNSALASVGFPGWHLGNYPEHEVMACSYNSALAMSFSRKVRNLVREPAYQVVFDDMRLDPDSQSVETWHTTEGGMYAALGVGGPATGRGAHVLLIDDPVKNRAEAESETSRDAVWDWYTSTAYTRLAPGGGVIVILTRWHDDDLAGRLLRAQKDGGDQWRVISYPAVAEVDEPYRNRGEALHPARYNLEALERIKRAVGPRDWQALYQQNPVADDGDYFTKNMISYYSQADLPDWDSMRFYTCWDLAIGQKDMNDWSVGITVGMDRKDDLYIIDIQRGRWGTLELADKILDVYETWRSSITGIERGQIEMAIGPFLDKRKRERSLPSFAYEPLSPRRGDKVARARSIQGRMMQHRVKFRRNCDVTNTLINELLRFPNGVNDDQCFVEGTLIDTPDGAKPIEALRIGDLVSTPYGAFPVEVAACTGVRDTSEIVFSDGTRLEGTGNHPVFTLNRGFVAIDNIDYADIMVKNIRGTETSTVTMTSVRATGKSVPVYNLCVRDIPVYFANGILVHNCDALAYIGLLLDEFVTPRIQAPAKQKSWRDKLDHYVKGRQSHGFMGA